MLLHSFCLFVFWFSGVRHPSLWNFIEVIKAFQVATENYMRDMKNGGAHPRRRRKFRKKDEDEGALERRINTLKEYYRNGQKMRMNVGRLSHISWVSSSHMKSMTPLDYIKLYENNISKNFAKLTRKHPCQSHFIKKETLTQVFFCEFCEIFKNTFP